MILMSTPLNSYRYTVQLGRVKDGVLMIEGFLYLWFFRKHVPNYRMVLMRFSACFFEGT